LIESAKFDNSDAQVYYNLAGALIQKEEFYNALESIEKCIKINPEFPNAQRLKSQLTELLEQ
jgi:tetratricopeptide (TPR) repeat protein